MRDHQDLPSGAGDDRRDRDSFPNRRRRRRHDHRGQRHDDDQVRDDRDHEEQLRREDELRREEAEEVEGETHGDPPRGDDSSRERREETNRDDGASGGASGRTAANGRYRDASSTGQDASDRPRRAARDPLQRFGRRTRARVRHVFRRSITVRGVGAALSSVSPRRLAALPDALGRLSRRVYVRRPDRKRLALGFYRSVRRPVPFSPLIFWAPWGFLLQKTAWRPIRLAAAACGASFAAGWEGIVESTRSAWGSIPSAWGFLTAPGRWWRSLLALADQAAGWQGPAAASRETESDSLLTTAGGASGSNRPRTAWTVAALTGVVGVILTFLLQFAGHKSAAPASERIVVAKSKKKSDVPLRTADVGTPRIERRSPRSARPPEPLALLPDASALSLTHSEQPSPAPEAEPPKKEEPPAAVEPPGPKPEPVLSTRLIALRRERTKTEELPSEEFLVQSTPPARDDAPAEAPRDDWKRFAPASGERPAAAHGVAYEQRLHPLDRVRIEADLARAVSPSEAPSPDVPSAGSDVSLEIEQRLPAPGGGEPQSIELVVRNAGSAALPQVQIEDAIADPKQILDLAPLGIIRDRAVHWAIGPLKPGEAQTLRMQIAPGAEGRIAATGRVRAFAAVSFQTAVAGPKLALEIASPSKLMMGDPCPIEYRIRNVGEGTATRVVLRQTLPAGLSHRSGRTLDLDIGTLEPGESREAHLTVTAAAPGAAEHQAVLLSEDKVRATVDVKVEIAERPAPREPQPRSGPQPRPTVRPAPPPPPRGVRGPAPCRTFVIDPCCCP